MTQLERNLKIIDKYGFHYNVLVKHNPRIGISIAYFEDEPIAQREYGKCCYYPVSDHDAEWESYEQRLHELADEMETDLNPLCIDYFNNKLHEQN